LTPRWSATLGRLLPQCRGFCAISLVEAEILYRVGTVFSSFAMLSHQGDSSPLSPVVALFFFFSSLRKSVFGSLPRAIFAAASFIFAIRYLRFVLVTRRLSAPVFFVDQSFILCDRETFFLPEINLSPFSPNFTQTATKPSSVKDRCWIT